jgi:hypothetical protein
MLSATAAVLNGAKRYFYASGTTTPINTYTTRALSVANANPVVADSGGLFGPIWITPGTNYREVLKDSSDNTIYDVDDQYPLTMDNATLSTQVYETAENPNHYGAAGTGSADESTDVQQAIDAAVANSREGVVDLMGRTYRCDSAITLYSGLTLRNGTLDFSNCTASEYIKALGTRASPVALTANVTAGDTSVTVGDNTSFAVNDLVYLYDNSGSVNGELVRVRSLSGGTGILLTSQVHDPYTTANTASIRKYTPVTDVRLENLVILANSNGSASRVLHLEVCANARISNCRFVGHQIEAIEVRSSIDVRIENCYINQNIFGLSNDVGIEICDQSQDVTIRGCSLTHQGLSGIRIGNNTASGTGGVTRNVVIDACSFTKTDVLIETQSEYVTVCNSGFSGRSSAQCIYIRGYQATITGCWFKDSTGVALEVDYDVTRSTASQNRRLIVMGNSFEGGMTVALALANATNSIDRFIFSGNNAAAANCTLSFASTPTIKFIQISNNNLGTGLISIDASSASSAISRIVIDGNQCARLTLLGATSYDVSDVIIRGNTLNCTSAKAMDLQKIRRLAVTDNVITGSASFAYGVYLLNTASTFTGCVISNNVIAPSAVAATSSAIRVDDTSLVSISGNTCSGGYSNGIYFYANTEGCTAISIFGNSISGIAAGDSYAAIRVEGDAAANPVGRASVVGNSIVSAGRAIRYEGDIDGGSITGNTCVVTDLVNSAIFLNGRAAGVIHTVTICGNSVSEGNNGLEAANTARVIHSGNAFNSQVSSHQTGISAGTSAAGGHYIS